MKILHDMNELKALNIPVGIALGTFDGVHMGHQAVITQLVETCKSNGCASVVLTFRNHPRDVTMASHQLLKLLPIEEKEIQIKSLGVEYLLMLEFTDEMMQRSPERFIDDIFSEAKTVKYLAVGFDYRFGKGATGDTQLLSHLQNQYDFELIIVEAVMLNGKKISSSEIRHLIRQGEVGKVISLLGRAFTVKGEVVHGKQMGRKLGYPTANLKINNQMTLIKPGVYVSKTHYNGHVYSSLTSVGYNPTFNQETLNLETYLLDFDGDLYGEILTVEFLDRIRDEERFSNLEDLVRRIDSDVVYARTFFDD